MFDIEKKCLCQQMQEISNPQIINTYSLNIYSGQVGDASGISKEHIKQLLSK